MSRRDSEKQASLRGSLARGVLVEDGDGEAMELTIGRLRHDLVDDARMGVGPDPVGDVLAQLLALTGLRSGKHLHASKIHGQAPFSDALLPSSSVRSIL